MFFTEVTEVVDLNSFPSTTHVRVGGGLASSAVQPNSSLSSARVVEGPEIHTREGGTEREGNSLCEML